MRILIVTPEYPPHVGGGILKYYRALAPALVRQGCDVTVLVSAPTSEDFSAYEDEGVRVKCVPRADSAARADELAQFSAAPEFRRWLAGSLVAGEIAGRAGSWDVIEAVDFGLGFVPFALNPHASPVVVQMHGSLGQVSEHEPARPDRLLDNALARLVELTLMPFASDLQTYASGNAAEWTARLDQPVRVQPPPMWPLASTIESAHVLKGDALVIGRVQAWKGPSVLCEALRQLPSEFPVVRWVGRDTATAPDGGSLSAHLALSYPDVWGSRIAPSGQRPFDEVQALMATAAMVIVPSDWDVFNFTAAEGMSTGRVVICSSRAGASDLISHGQNGFVFHAGDHTSLADSLRAAIALSPAERTAMGQAARDTIVSRLNPDAIAADRVSRYRAIAASASTRCVAPADWLREAFAGSASQRVGPEFLDQMNVRDLSKYLGRRLRNRLVDRLGGRSGRRIGGGA